MTGRRCNEEAETKIKPRSGAEIDSAAADALAAQAERGYDLSKAKRRRVGRPSLGAGDVAARELPRDAGALSAAKRRAREEGRTVSELARDAVARYVGS